MFGVRSYHYLYYLNYCFHLCFYYGLMISKLECEISKPSLNSNRVCTNAIGKDTNPSHTLLILGLTGLWLAASLWESPNLGRWNSLVWEPIVIWRKQNSNWSQILHRAQRLGAWPIAPPYETIWLQKPHQEASGRYQHWKVKHETHK